MRKLAYRHGSVLWVVLIAACIMPLLVLPARGVPILGQNDWDDYGHGWTNTYGLSGWSSIQRMTNGLGSPGSTSGWLQVDFDATAEPEAGQDEWYEMFYTPAANLFDGPWSTNMWVEFDFWASNTLPNSLQVRWSGNNNMWGYTITDALTLNGWSTSIKAPLTNWEKWEIEPFMDESQYLADLAAINWIGIWIYRDGADSQVYGIDDFKLMIPEPSQYLMLAAAIAASALSLRKKKRTAQYPAPA